jgi:hypothetical protein
VKARGPTARRCRVRSKWLPISHAPPSEDDLDSPSPLWGVSSFRTKTSAKEYPWNSRLKSSRHERSPPTPFLDRETKPLEHGGRRFNLVVDHCLNGRLLRGNAARCRADTQSSKKKPGSWCGDGVSRTPPVYFSGLALRTYADLFGSFLLWPAVTLILVLASTFQKGNRLALWLRRFHARRPAGMQFDRLLPKSGVKFTVFVQICPKIGVCSRNLCSC